MGKNEGKKIAIVALVSTALGFLTGILTAPKSGKETREDIKNTANKVARETEKRLKQLHSDLASAIAKAEEIIKAQGDKAAKGLQEALSAARAGQQKVREMLSAIRAGESNDPELEKAMKEAEKAKEHLKAYFQK